MSNEILLNTCQLVINTAFAPMANYNWCIEPLEVCRRARTEEVVEFAKFIVNHIGELPELSYITSDCQLTLSRKAPYGPKELVGYLGKRFIDKDTGRSYELNFVGQDSVKLNNLVVSYIGLAASFVAEGEIPLYKEVMDVSWKDYDKC